MHKISLSIVLLTFFASACAPAGDTGSGGDAAVPAEDEGRSLQNPVAATPESVASGQKLYERFCADCHGVYADGVSAIAAAMPEGEVRPPNLIDAQWDHGSTDGDIFVGIRDGVGGGAMKGLNGRPGVGPAEMWHMVNYIRSLQAP